MAEDRPVLSIRLRRSVVDRLDTLCEKSGISRSELIERVVDLGLADQEEFISWLEGRVSGPIFQWLVSPNVLRKLMEKAMGEMNETQVKIVENVGKNRRGSGTKIALKGV